MYVQTCQGSEHRSVRPHVFPQTWAQWAGPVEIENTNTIQNTKYRIQNVCTNLPRDLPSAALALTPIQTRAPGSTGTDARVGAPSRETIPVYRREAPKTKHNFAQLSPPGVPWSSGGTSLQASVPQLGQLSQIQQPSSSAAEKQLISLTCLSHTRRKLVTSRCPYMEIGIRVGSTSYCRIAALPEAMS